MWARAGATTRRPAFVVSPAAYCASTGFALVCPIEDRARGYLFEVRVPPGLDDCAVIVADRVTSLHARSWSLTRFSTLDEGVVLAVLAKLAGLETR